MMHQGGSVKRFGVIYTTCDKFCSFLTLCKLDETDDKVEAGTESFESIEVGNDGGESHDGDDGKSKSHGGEAISPENVLAIKSTLNRNYRFAVSITTLVLPITDIRTRLVADIKADLIIGTALHCTSSCWRKILDGKILTNC